MRKYVSFLPVCILGAPALVRGLKYCFGRSLKIAG